MKDPQKTRKKSSLATKLVIFAICIYSVVSLISLQTDANRIKGEITELEAQVEEKNQMVLRLKEDIKALDTPEGIRNIAREKLGYVEEGEIIFHITGQDG